MKHFLKCSAALDLLCDTLLAGGRNGVRVLKEAGHMSQRSVKKI